MLTIVSYIYLSSLSSLVKCLKIFCPFNFNFVLFLFFLNKFIYLFKFWLCWVFVAARGLSLVVASGGYSSLWCTGFSSQWLLLLQSTGSRCVGLVAPRHVGSSLTRARTYVPCIGRQILNHCTTREALVLFL